MNAGSSLTKYVPWENEFIQDWRVVRSTEGLGYLATALLASDPVDIKMLKVRVNLGATDAQTQFTHHIKSFFKAMKTYNKMTKLDLGFCQITDHTCKEHVMPMLEMNTTLEELMLNDNAFTDFGVKCIFSAFTLNRSKIHTISLQRNDFTFDSMDAVARAISTDKFKNLDLGHSRLGAEGVRVLKPALSKVTALSVLNLENSQIGDEGCVELAEMIGAGGMFSVSNLNIAENHIGRIGIEKLVANFVPEKGLPTMVDTLDVSRNYFGDEGFGCVMDMMRKNLSMKTLKVQRCGFTNAKFITFCEKMLQRYEQQFGPYPDLETLEVGLNGLGNEIDALCAMIKHRNCRLKYVNYEGNEVTDFGAKKWAEFIKGWDCNRENAKDGDNFDKAAIKVNTEDFNKERLLNKQGRKNFYKLSLKSNAITVDGAEHLAGLVNANKVFNELDMRKNNIGVKGAIFFKKAIRKWQCNINNYGRTFKLHLLPTDVTNEGVNHLAIAIRESPWSMKRWIKEKRGSDLHKYNRPDALVRAWGIALATNSEKIVRKEVIERTETNEADKQAQRQARKELKSLDLEKKSIFGSSKQVYHGLGHNTRFMEFDTPDYKDDARKLKTALYKRGIIIYGENDEKEDTWAFVTLTTYMSVGIVENNRGVYKWHPYLWALVQQGWGCVIANTLYRYGLMLRLQYFAEDELYIKDLYLQRIGKRNWHNFSLMRTIASMDIEQLVYELVAIDIQNLWEQLISQNCERSQGMTMFEYVLKFADSPVIDVVRQFLNVFPAVAYAQPGSKRPGVFLQQTIGRTGASFQQLCLECNDKFVKRYGEAKNLVLFRFLEVEPIYRSRFVKISKVEDLLLTEEYDDTERFFYMRKIAGTKAQEEEKLAMNEFDTHRSFMNVEGSYLSSGDSLDKIDNFILPNVNMNLEIEFLPMVSQLSNRKQLLSDDKLMPTFTTMFKTNLREVLDNQCLAGGRDLDRSQIILRMIATALDRFNTKGWVNAFNKGDTTYADPHHLELINKSRIHGNVKPRNIVLRVIDELPDLDKGIDLMPAKWVLSDFTRSTPHGELYLPIVNSAYNPPEVAKRVMTDEKRVKAKVEANEKMDVWQFGCILFEMLSGTTLFKMEGRDDTLMDDVERGELANWLSLDEERSSLILNQLQNYSSINYDEAELKKIVESGRQLCEMCLQGRPGDRPTFTEILNHPFLKNANIGKLGVEKDQDQFMNVFTKYTGAPGTATGWDNSNFLRNQPHLHLMNTEFDQAGLIVKSLEQSLGKIGCRLTTDSLEDLSKVDTYEATLKNNIHSARVIACLLTRDAFYKPNVVKQLLYAEDFRRKEERPDARILFLDLSAALDLKKDNLEWSKDLFRDKWTLSDEFQYLVKALAQENPSLSSFSVANVAYDDRFDSWNKLLNENVRPLILSYVQEPIKYMPQDFMCEPMLDRMLTDGHLVAINKMKSYSPPSLSDSNFKDPSDLLNRKLAERKDKFLDLYFLPALKVRKGDARVYVLCGKSALDETFQAVSQIAQTLEAPSSVNQVADENKHKDAYNPKNKLFNKVKTSYNLKKDSHLKTSGRSNFIQVAKDAVLNISREDGPLIVVMLCTPGVFKRYTKFLHSAVEKRQVDDKNEFVILLMAGPGWKAGGPDEKKEIDAFCPTELKDYARDKDNYLPYFKPKREPWLYDASMNELIARTAYKMDHPRTKENFSEIEA